MKVNIKTLQDTFKYGYEQSEDSRIEAATIWDYYHNRQYNTDQLNELANRGQPAETFNVVKLFSRMLLGYYSSVVNTVQALPVQQEDTDGALLINDVLQQIFHTSNFSAEGDKIKLSGIISGLMVAYEEVVETGRVDKFGRKLYEVQLSHVPDSEIVLDPSSRKEDYSDANWIHRFRWLHEDVVVQTFGRKVLEKLEAHANTLEQQDTEFLATYNEQFVGKYKVYDNYLIVHSVMLDDKGRSWSVLWSGDEILSKEEISHKDVTFPYRVHKLHVSDKVEYYGLFREVLETQKAINQALIKFQLLANSQKAFVEDGAVEDIDEFTLAYNRVSGVIPVSSLKGIQIQDLSREALEQYVIIDKAFDRIQRILSINDSFLGMAFASDSGRKVKLQQNATITALRYLTGRIEQFYRLLGEDTFKLVRQYYTANQVLRIADTSVGQRWIELNKPLEVWTGTFDAAGEPVMETQYEEVIDPVTNDVMITDEGRIVIAPIPERGTELAITDVDITITSVSYNDEDEKNQLMLETLLSGNVGSLLAQVNPAGFFQAASLSVKTVQTKHSADISKILEDTAAMLSGDQAAQQQASAMAQGSPDANSQMSSQLKLPEEGM